MVAILWRPAGDQVTDRQDEQQLIAAVKAGDLDAFETLFERYQPSLLRSIAFQMRDVEAAHDIVQETFLRVWQARASLKPALSFQALIYRIGINLVRDLARHAETRRRTAEDVPRPVPPDNADPEKAAQHALLLDALRHAIVENLPERCRAVFQLSRLEGLSIPEVAERLGISAKTAENQLTKALRILRRALRHHLPPDA
jgi:RNA polymerase sigma-70 factor, ECF subfamily